MHMQVHKKVGVCLEWSVSLEANVCACIHPYPAGRATKQYRMKGASASGLCPTTRVHTSSQVLPLVLTIMRAQQKQPNSHKHMAHTCVALQAGMTWWICIGGGSVGMGKGAHTGETERKNETKRGRSTGSAQCKRLHMVAMDALPHAYPRLMPTKHNVCCGATQPVIATHWVYC